MPQLPHACPEEGHELGQAPVHGPRVGLFAQCPELGLAFPLELLLASDVGEAVVELAHLEDETTRKAGSARSRDRRLDTRGAHLGTKVLDVFPLSLLVNFGLADGDVEVHPDLRGGEPPAGVVGPEADGVVSGLVGREGELALGHPTRVDDLVPALDLLETHAPVVSARVRASPLDPGRDAPERRFGSPVGR